MRRDGARPESVFRHLVVDLAPYAYETMLGLPSCRETCSVDLERAQMQAEALSSTNEAASRVWERAFARAGEIVARHRRHIEMLGDELARRGHMGGDEIRRTLAAAGFRPAAASSTELRYRAGTMTPRQVVQSARSSRREIYAAGRRIGWTEPHDRGGELGYLAYRSGGEPAGCDAIDAAARSLRSPMCGCTTVPTRLLPICVPSRSSNSSMPRR
jgi:hypothetical protein